jgi:hypothetical protein
VTTCERCGKELQIGEWPLCGGKHDHGFPLRGMQVVSDELPNGPYWCETLGHEPVWVESKSHLRREAKARNLEEVGGRKSDAYFAKHRQMQQECIRDTGRTLDGVRVRES